MPQRLIVLTMPLQVCKTRCEREKMISELSAAQWQQVTLERERWLRIGTCTDLADRETPMAWFALPLMTLSSATCVSTLRLPILCTIALGTRTRRSDCSAGGAATKSVASASGHLRGGAALWTKRTR